MELRRLYANYAYLIYSYKIIFGMVDLTTSDFFQWPLAQVSEDIPLNYIRTAVLHVSDPHFSVSTLLTVADLGGGAGVGHGPPLAHPQKFS